MGESSAGSNPAPSANQMQPMTGMGRQIKVGLGEGVGLGDADSVGEAVGGEGLGVGCDALGCGPGLGLPPTEGTVEFCVGDTMAWCDVGPPSGWWATLFEAV